MERTPALDENVTLVLGAVRLPARVDAVFPGRFELALGNAPTEAFVSALFASVEAAGRRFAGRARLLPPLANGDLLAEFSTAA
jgi:hypothetical protein